MNTKQININIPKNVKLILDTLNSNGYESYIVGGAIRDLYLGRPVADWDICTSATPTEIFQVFKDYKTIPTGLKHGTITIQVEDKFYEVTTFRIDGEYIDGRKPDHVTFTTSLEEDLRRRDFTINAIAYNEDAGIVDLFNGISDLNNKIIRCVGSPSLRFREDGLRVMRAIRFAAQLDFKIEPFTSQALRNSKDYLNSISNERIMSELCKILESRCCGYNALKQYSDVIAQFIPEIGDTGTYEWDRTLYCMSFLFAESCNTPYDDIILRLSLLLHDIGKPYLDADSAKTAYKILKRLKFSNEILGYTTQLISYCNDNTKVESKQTVKKLLNKLGEKQLRRLILLKRLISIMNNKQLKIYETFYIENTLNKILEKNECYCLNDLSVNGDDLIRIGIPQGKEIGNILLALLDLVIEEKVANNKEELLQAAKKIDIISTDKVIC